MVLVDKTILEDALKKALERSGKRKFKQSVEMIIVLRDFDPKSPEGRIREIVFLKKGLGKKQNICVVAEGDMALKAKDSGAYMVLSREDLQELQGNRKKAKKIAEACDWVLVRTDLMALAGRTLGPALGPRGKIPVPVPPNADISSFIKRYENAVIVRVKDQPQIMCRIGTEDMGIKDLVENAETILSVLEGKIRGPYNIEKIIFKTTMGTPVVVTPR